jgi:Tfp pilus assembly protein PilN
MRPVNLIPPDERRGDSAPMRTGALPYVLIGGLAVALLAVIALAFTSKQISDRKNDVAKLQQEEQQANAKAQGLQAFTTFRTMQESREATVSSLAESRFDWQRVLNEFARVIPADVWFTQVAGTVTPGVQLQNAPEISMREGVTGPALELVGCAPSQDSVAGLVSDLESIDGVTRVGVQSSERSDDDTGGSTATVTSGSGSSSGSDCRTRSFITKFEIVVAFDAVPTPGTATSVPSLPSAVAPSGSQLASDSTGSTGGGG